MKKISILLVLFMFSACFLLAEFRDPTGFNRIPVINYDTSKLIPVTESYNRDNYPVPEYEFVAEPYAIMTSWYDYMPGSYEGFALRKQTDNGNGTYLTWHGNASVTAERRQYWAYADSTGSIGGNNWGTISTYDLKQGYGGIAVHPATGNCLATWHEDPSGSNYGSTICYEDYAFLSIPGFWSLVTFIPSPSPDEYIWPYFWVGPSPTDGYVRLYMTSKNYTNDALGFPCEDMRIMFMDIENTFLVDMTTILDLANWTTRTPMYYWRAKSCRPLSECFAIDYNNPGHIAIIGYAAWLNGDMGDMPVDPGFYVWESSDYGDTWDLANLHGNGSQDYLYIVDNIPGFEGNDHIVLDELLVDLAGSHNNAHYDSEGNIHVTYMQQYGFTDAIGDSYYFDHFLPQAEAVWDGSDWTYHEVPAMPGIDPRSGHTVPWEIVGPDTLKYTTVTWNKYPGSDAPIFHENVQRYAINTELDWMVRLWADGTGVQLAEDEEPGWEDYATHPILYISISPNNGQNWSDPIELTDIYSTLYDFSDQITVYPNIYNKIEDIGDNWGLVHMYYYDDNSFGSYINGGPTGDNLGGQITYCSVKIEFPDTFSVVDPGHENPVASLSNYPNPFFASTTINFTSKKPYQHSSVSVYNTRGQLINTLNVQAGEQPTEGYATWSGKDMNGNDVANGIYLYKVEIDDAAKVQKMMLTR